MVTKFVNFFFNKNLYGVAVGKTMIPELSQFVLVMKKLPHILAFIRDSSFLKKEKSLDALGASKWLQNGFTITCIRMPYKMLTKFVNFFFQ